MTEKKKTPDEDFRRFEKFIDDMSDMEYDAWLQDPRTSNLQKDLADEIREELDEDEARAIIESRRDALRRFRI